MSEMKELNHLPEELKMWGEQALSEIESPERRHEAAVALRQEIDSLWNECSSESYESKVLDVLSKLGNVEARAEKLKKDYAWKSNPRTDIKIGSIFLILSALCGMYAFMAFFVFPNDAESEASIYATYLTGRGAGSGAACAIVLGVLGLLILLNARKGDK